MQKISFCERYKLTTAVLNGTKTMTRRVEKGLETFEFDYEVHFAHSLEIINQYWDEDKNCLAIITPQCKMKAPTRYKLGEVVAVAQSYETLANSGHLDKMVVPANNPVKCEFKKEYCNPGWLNKMFVRADLMPHQIKITGVRIERLQAISDDDCLKEGVFDSNVGYNRFGFRDKHCDHNWYYPTPRKAFAALIDRPGVGRKGLWKSNPFVVVYEFKLVK